MSQIFGPKFGPEFKMAKFMLLQWSKIGLFMQVTIFLTVYAHTHMHAHSVTANINEFLDHLKGFGGIGSVVGVGPEGGGMWQREGACGRVWMYVAGVDVCGRGSGLWHGQGHVARVGACGRV